MKFGASMCFADYSMAPTELAVASGQGGFDIVRAPEHSHVPLSPKTPFIMGGTFRYSARRAIRYGNGGMPQVAEYAKTPLIELDRQFRQMAAENGRDPASLEICIGGQRLDVDLIRRYQDAGVNRVSCSLESDRAPAILPILDQWAENIRRVNG